MNTAPELILRRALSALGVRYRLGARDLPGKPDLVFRRLKVAVFCDGEFWHGRRWPMLRAQLKRGANPTYWIAKIAYNRRRDKMQTRRLKADGWEVVRLWEGDIRRRPNLAAKRVIAAIRRREAQDPG